VIDREFGQLLQIKDNHEKVVVSLDEIKFSDYEEIRHFRPWELGKMNGSQHVPKTKGRC
jgi:hypothetical protein